MPFDAHAVALFGASLVEASAGTGKTHAISTLVVRLVAERGLPLEQVLVVTFTEAAAAELKSRVRARLAWALEAVRARRSSRAGSVEGVGAAGGANEREVEEPELIARLMAVGAEDAAQLDPALSGSAPTLGEARLEIALRQAGEAAISTIHGFCHRALLEAAFDSRSPFEVELVPDMSPLLEEVVRDYWALHTLDADEELLTRLEHHHVTLASCLMLAARAVSDPALHILPRVTEAPEADPQPLVAALVKACEAFDPGGLRRAMLGVNGQKIRDSGALLDAIWRLLTEAASGRLPRELPKHAELLTPQSLPLRKGQPRPTHPFFSAWAEVLEAFAQYERERAEQVAAFVTGLVDYVRAEVPQRKQARGLCSYDDLLQRLDAALSGPDGSALAARLRARFPAALIDEFQDTDAVQWRIFQRIYSPILLEEGGDRGFGSAPDNIAAPGAAGAPRSHSVNHTDSSSAGTHTLDSVNYTDLALFLIGDPKQAIYSFRGADLNVYLAATRAVHPARRYTMTTNYRTDPALLGALNALYGRLTSPFFLERVGYPQVEPRPGSSERLSGASGAALQIVTLDEELAKDLPELCAQEVLSLLARDARGEPRFMIEGRALGASDIGVLTHTNKQALEVREALARHQVPCVVLGDQSVFEPPECDELRLLLHATLERQPRLIKSALLTGLVGLSAHEVDALDRDDAGWDLWTSRFRRWYELWAERGVVQMLSQVLSDLGSYERLLGMADGERRLTNVLHLMELLHTAARSAQLGPAGLLAWLDIQRRVPSERAEDAQVRLERDERAVKIATVHQSKGLEYPVVIAPFVTVGQLLHASERRQPLFHDPARGGARTLLVDLGVDLSAAKALAETEHLQEDLRLLYVALTRARHRVILHWGPVRSYTASALGYLLHPPGGGLFTPDADWLKGHLKAKKQTLVAELAELPAVVPSLEVRGAAARAPDYVEPERELPKLAARKATRDLDLLHRTTSFSGLTSRAASLELDPEEGKDRDQIEADAAAGPVLAPELPLLAFPRGTKAGHFFHDLLEHHDFTAGEAALARLAARKLTAHGYDPGLAEDVAFGLQRALSTPLTPGGNASPIGSSGSLTDSATEPALRLADVPRAARLDELEFYFPVGQAGTDGEPLRLDAAQLAEVFRAHPSPALHPGYAQRVAALGFAPVGGFLKGYIDLVLRTPGGRYYLLDYKTNTLGDTPAAYAAPRLAEAMSHSHYYLQYHLYTLALVRYLAARLPSFEYERDFGGVFYLFLRGMAPELGATSGVFFERPPRARVEALSRAMRGAGVALDGLDSAGLDSAGLGSGEPRGAPSSAAVGKPEGAP
ncbi:MAG: UvrD-helicase domain-containing protein [Polyangiaceae bacterium]|nr:UvrD-helicase domain-containing protein [Polyangiaceae bacterium]MCW5791008.1 UvrD-helicase domain-containing protein [Polyangiaceae bacterium]